MLSNIDNPEKNFKYYCEICDYGTGKKSNINNHYKTLKHLKSTTVNTKEAILLNHSCQICNKTYKDNSGLWRHNKKCHPKIEVNEKEKDNENADKEIIKMLIKENSEFKNMILDIVKTFQRQHQQQQYNKHQ